MKIDELEKWYSIEDHKRILLYMLENNDLVCTQCPANIRTTEINKMGEKPIWWWSGSHLVYAEFRMHIHKICKNFVGISSEGACPCTHLDEEEAIKRTWIALDE